MQQLLKIRITSFILTFSIGVLFPINSLAEESNKNFLIAPFENLSNYKSMALYEVPTNEKEEKTRLKYTIDRYSELPRSLLEDEVLNMGGSVVERQQVDHLLREESEGVRLSGLVDPSQIIEKGKMGGATHVVFGTITSIRTVESKVKLRGFEIKLTKLICSLRIRIVDVETGMVKFSKRAKGLLKYQTSNSGGTVDDDSVYSAIEKGIEALFDDNQFENFVRN